MVCVPRSSSSRKPCGLVPVEHLRRGHAGLRHQLRDLHEGRAVFLVRAARPSRCGWRAVAGVDAEVAPEARVGRGQAHGGGQQAVRRRDARPASARRPAARCGSLQADAGGKASRRRWPGARELSWIIDSTNPPGADLRNPAGRWRRSPPTDISRSVPMPDLTRAARRRCRPPLPLALLSLALLHAHGALGAGRRTSMRRSRSSARRSCAKTIPPAQRGQLPSFVDGDRISGRPDLETVIEGNASLRRGDTVIHADRLEYYQPDDLAKATGNVRINQAGNVYEGPELRAQARDLRGLLQQRALPLPGDRRPWRGRAHRLRRRATSRSRATPPTPPAGARTIPGWMPAWMLSAATAHAPTPRKTSASPPTRG